MPKKCVRPECQNTIYISTLHCSLECMDLHENFHKARLLISGLPLEVAFHKTEGWVLVDSNSEVYRGP